MHRGCECIGENQTLLDAAKRMEQRDIGGMPICGEDDRLKGMLTDRDIVVKALAQGKDPATTRCGEFAQGSTVWIRADASLEDALARMREQAVKRMPVVDDDKRLCGIVTEADIATHLPEQRIGEFVGSIASAPPQHF
jgi:CBS domain-containing protein